MADGGWTLAGWCADKSHGAPLVVQAALDHVLQRTDVDASHVFIFGRSLGGAVAIHLAAENQDKVRPWYDSSA